jgi:hypothetical protein
MCCAAHLHGSVPWEPEPTLRGVVGRADADRLEEIWKRGGTVVMGPPSRIEVAYGP